MKPRPFIRHHGSPAFTLIELLVVMIIIAVLAVMLFGGFSSAMLKARKLTCASTMKNAGDGIMNYMADNYGKPPAPKTKQLPGNQWDTIYGNPGGNYSSEWLLAVLLGMEGSYQIDGQTEDTKIANPTLTAYAQFDRKNEPKGGLYIEDPDGTNPKPKLYDPWGREIIFAINSVMQENDASGGNNDKALDTYGFCQYADLNNEPKNFVRQFAMISYGDDAKKGKEQKDLNDSTATFAKSDDVISW